MSVRVRRLNNCSLAMNALVNYTSDSDPEFEQEDVSHATTTKRSISQRPNLTNNTNNNCTIDGAEDDGDENYVAAALKDIRNLATIAPAPPSNHIMQCTSPSPMQDNENEGLASEDLEVMAFLKTIEDIPYPSDEQDAVLLPPPPPPPSIAPTTVTPPPPPPPPPPPFSLLEASLDVQPGDDKSKKALETTLQDIHTIQNRLYYISLLPSSTVDQKDLDRRLLEFATRVKDWEKGGLYESYFVGKERAEAMANNTNFYLSEAEKSTLPPFGGVMGTMIKHMYDLENIVAPPGWIAVWDADDEAYGFQHLRTGTYSSVYPSQELIQHLNPPFRPSGSPVSSRNSRPHFVSQPVSYIESPSPSLIQGHTNQATSPNSTISSVFTSESIGSSSALTAGTPKLTSTSLSATSTKTKKRKAETFAVESTAETNVSSDQNIHPSRRTIFTNRPGLTSSSSTLFGTGGSSSKTTMPKKLANLLQKWSEKELEHSDEDSNDDNDHADDGPESAMTGANSQSLGSDWRDRRLHSR